MIKRLFERFRDWWHKPVLDGLDSIRVELVMLRALKREEMRPTAAKEGNVMPFAPLGPIGSGTKNFW